MLYVKTENLVQLGSISKNLVLKNEEGTGLGKKDNFGLVFCKKKKKKLRRAIRCRVHRRGLAELEEAQIRFPWGRLKTISIFGWADSK